MGSDARVRIFCEHRFRNKGENVTPREVVSDQEVTIYQNAVIHNAQVLATTGPMGIEAKTDRLPEPFRSCLGGRNSVRLTPNKCLH